VKSGKTPLPGVTVTAANTLTGKKYTAATALDGTFTFKNVPRGRYVVKVEFMGFATMTQEVVLNPENPAGKVEAELVLASRQQEQQAEQRASAAANAGRGFQSLSVEGGLAGLGDTTAGGGNSTVSANDLSSLPMSGAGADIAAESVSVTGAQGRSQDFGNGNEDDLQNRVQEFRERAQAQGGNQFGVMGPGGAGGIGGGPAGGGGFGGPGGGGGGIAMGRYGRNFNLNQPHGFLYVQDDNANLDARPYSLNGLPLPQSDYNQLKVGAFIGTPLKIPGLFDWSKTTFITFGWYGVRGSTPYDAISTVPTTAERTGDFAGLTQNGSAVTIYNPQTGQPFLNNAIDPSLISAQAKALLQYIPLPNMPGALQNYQYVTTNEANTDNVSFRLVENFIPNSTPTTQRGGAGGRGGGGGGRRNSGPRNNLAVGFNFTRNNADVVNPFPSLAGHTDTQGWNGNARWTYGKGKITNALSFTYNHNRTTTTNLYSEVTDVSGNAGISTPVPSIPFNWGLPGISLTSYAGFNDPSPSRELDQTYTISDQIVWTHGKNNWRFGGDYRRILQGFRSAENSQGAFTFTGFATTGYETGTSTAIPDTGNAFADFLLGFPQQTTLQASTADYAFRANSFDGYVQDDWRVRPNLSLNLGVRYEYNGPFVESNNQIANLDVNFNPQSVAGYLVLPGQSGPFFGGYPNALVRPSKNDWAPRIGIAWKPMKDTVVRTGYGINYDLSQYSIFVRDFAFQPPFAITQTNKVDDVTVPGSLTLADGFPTQPSEITNNYGLNPNYRLGYVQIWNLDIQRQLRGNVQLNVGYNGSKGTHLDTQRALVPSCSLTVPISCASNEVVSPFIYDSSEGNSILNAATVRIRKRLSRGFAVNAIYVFSKSLDDASSIGGGGVTVIQNPFDLPAERALSTFDQTHSLTGNWIYDLPFGDNRRFLNKGWISHVIGGWQWSGSYTIASGLYFTPFVTGSTTDINRGVNSSIRANVVAGQTISLPNPSTKEWFNTAAYCQTGLSTCTGPTVYGDAGRDIIEGPWQYTFNSAINKTITIRETRSLELRLSATNILNTPYFSGINTTVNSLTFGQVTGVSNMRRITMIARFRF
jgi:hypothetical protein